MHEICYARDATQRSILCSIEKNMLHFYAEKLRVYVYGKCELTIDIRLISR